MNEYRVTLKFSPHLTGLTRVRQPHRMKVWAKSPTHAIFFAVDDFMREADANSMDTLSDVIVTEIDSPVRAIVGRSRK